MPAPGSICGQLPICAEKDWLDAPRPTLWPALGTVLVLHIAFLTQELLERSAIHLGFRVLSRKCTRSPIRQSC